MDYRIETLSSFSVIGMETQLTNRQSQNIIICKSFWRIFNLAIKKAYLSPHGNWIKFAFTYKKNDTYRYFCALPKVHVVPDGFIQMNVDEQKYMVVEHRGDMDTIYKTYSKIYKELLPQSGYIAVNEHFFHFEKYDYRFHWGRIDSVIEIWIPTLKGDV